MTVRGGGRGGEHGGRQLVRAEKVEKYLAFWRDVWYSEGGQMCVCVRLNIID